MAKIKGMALFAMRAELMKKGEATYLEFINGLPPHLRHCFQTVLYNQWVPIETFVAVAEALAGRLYPGDAQAFFKIGHFTARDHMSGVYRWFVRMLSTTFLLHQAANIWKLYHDEGRLKIEGSIQERDATVVIQDYPGLPKEILEVNAGFMTASLELASAKNVRVMVDASDPLAWRWRIRWD